MVRQHSSFSEPQAVTGSQLLSFATDSLTGGESPLKIKLAIGNKVDEGNRMTFTVTRHLDTIRVDINGVTRAIATLHLGSWNIFGGSSNSTLGGVRNHAIRNHKNK